MKQLRELARPFPVSQIETKPVGGGRDEDYVAHHIVQQRLVSILGTVPRQNIVREIYDGEKLTGVVMEMSTRIDGRHVAVQEAGDIQGNEKTNGARLKNATSDAYKRCAMRMTLGLHLWAQEHYWLDAWWTKQEQSNGDVTIADVEDVGGEPTVTEQKKGGGAANPDRDGAGETDTEQVAHAPSTDGTVTAPTDQPPDLEGEVDAARRRRYFAILGDLAKTNVDNPGFAGDWKNLAHTIVKRQYQVESTKNIPAADFDTFLNALSNNTNGVQDRFVAKVNDEWGALQAAQQPDHPEPEPDVEGDEVARIREEMRRKFGSGSGDAA